MIKLITEAVLRQPFAGAVKAVGTATDIVRHVAIEVKRRAEMASVEQLSRYLDYLNRDPLLAPVGGVLAALTIPPQVRVYAADQGIRCHLVDYDDLRGMTRNDLRLF